MAMSIEELQSRFDANGLKYSVDPTTARLLLKFGGEAGTYDIVVTLEGEGRFLQYRSLQLLSCPADHPHLQHTLRLLASINYENRFLKLGWDPSDGEIVAYADVILDDGTITEAQARSVTFTFLMVLDGAYGKLQKAIEEGPNGEGAERASLESGRPSEALRRLLERARARSGGS
jgi:hypothetical protein